MVYSSFSAFATLLPRTPSFPLHKSEASSSIASNSTNSRIPRTPRPGLPPVRHTTRCNLCFGNAANAISASASGETQELRKMLRRPTPPLPLPTNHATNFAKKQSRQLLKTPEATLNNEKIVDIWSAQDVFNASTGLGEDPRWVVYGQWKSPPTWSPPALIEETSTTPDAIYHGNEAEEKHYEGTSSDQAWNDHGFDLDSSEDEDCFPIVRQIEEEEITATGHPLRDAASPAWAAEQQKPSELTTIFYTEKLSVEDEKHSSSPTDAISTNVDAPTTPDYPDVIDVDAAVDSDDDDADEDGDDRMMASIPDHCSDDDSSDEDSSEEEISRDEADHEFYTNLVWLYRTARHPCLCEKRGERRLGGISDTLGGLQTNEEQKTLLQHTHTSPAITCICHKNIAEKLIIADGTDDGMERILKFCERHGNLASLSLVFEEKDLKTMSLYFKS